MKHFLSALGSSRRMARFCAIVLMLLVLGGAALPAVQAQGTIMYVFLFNRNPILQEYSNGNNSFTVNRIALSGGYGHEAIIELCFSGSATYGEDYYVRDNAKRFGSSSSCFIDKFRNGERSVKYYISPVNDALDEGNETLTVTMATSLWPSGYLSPGGYNRTSFTIIDND